MGQEPWVPAPPHHTPLQALGLVQVTLKIPHSPEVQLLLIKAQRMGPGVGNTHLG